MTAQKNIVLIGAGNVATQLGITLSREGYRIKQVYSRSKKSAEILAKKLKAKAITSLKELSTEASIYIIALPDDVIVETANHIKLKDQIVVHTSGSVSIDVLKNISKNYGVFYPLQTFSKGKNVNFKNVPVCIEANNATASTELLYFAKSISKNVQKINSEQRKKIHLAAVFACNFSNHMYTIAEQLLAKDKLSLDLLKPLIEETANKIKDNKPSKMQTGPAIRGDKKTMEAHLKMLKENKELQKIYQLVSTHIITPKQK